MIAAAFGATSMICSRLGLAGDAKRVAVPAGHDGAFVDHDELALGLLDGVLQRLLGGLAGGVHDRLHVVHRQDVENDLGDVRVGRLGG